MKQRSIGMCILLTIVTCGIYGLYWFVCITDDTNEMSGENELAGGGTEAVCHPAIAVSCL